MSLIRLHDVSMEIVGRPVLREEFLELGSAIGGLGFGIGFLGGLVVGVLGLGLTFVVLIAFVTAIVARRALPAVTRRAR